MPKIPRLFDDHPELLKASPSETTPWLLELARAQASRRAPLDLLARLEHDRFVQPSFLDQRLANQLDGLALNAAPEFDALLLSPVAPLGTCSVLAPSSQDRTLSTTRGSEVVSDPTNVLALECARRLRAGAAHIQLCSVHQVLRAQALPPQPGFSRHFRLFVLAEAGASEAEDGFELRAIGRQISCFMRFFTAAKSALGCRFSQRRLVVKTSEKRKALRDRLLVRLSQLYWMAFRAAQAQRASHEQRGTAALRQAW